MALLVATLAVLFLPLYMGASLELWALFIAGQMLYIMKKASVAIRAKTNPLETRTEYLRLYWDIILYRSVIGAVIFWTYASYPDLFTQAASTVGFTLNLTLPLVGPVAFVLGLASDVLLDWIFQKIPFLSRELPSIPANADGEQS